MTDDTPVGTGLATGALLADLESSEAETEEKSEGEAKTETENEADAESSAGEEDAGADKTEGDGDVDADASEDEDEKPKRKSLPGSEKWKRRALAAESQLAQSRLQDGNVSLEAVRNEIGDPPKEEDFKGDFLAYERAMTAYELDARQTARDIRRRAALAQQTQQEALMERIAEHREAEEEFRKIVPDYDKWVNDSFLRSLSPVVANALIETDPNKSAHLALRLAKNRNLLDRLNRMGEVEAAREIGRIEAHLSLPSPKTETKAPKPVVPPKGGAAPRSQDADLDAFLKRTYPGHYR